MKFLALATLLITTPLAALAESYAPIREEDRFLSLVEDRDLRIALYGLRLRVREDGTIKGSALGWDITGRWSWKDGYFCRELSWGGDPIPYNCQLVEARGDTLLRFTVDRGAGRSAAFRLQ